MQKLLKPFVLAVGLLFTLQVYAQKPVYRFTFKVYINEATATFYGGKTAVENQIKAQFASVNQFYNQESRFTGAYNFEPTTFSYFRETGQNQNVLNSIANQSPETGHDFRILYSHQPFPDPGGYPTIVADYQVITRSIRFAIDAEHEWIPAQNLFGPTPTRILCHELGHARGASDLYSVDVDSLNNAVNQKGYKYPISSIMNYLYEASAGWDVHSIASINKAANNVLTAATWKTLLWSQFPAKMSVRVKNSQGALLPNTKVTLYGVRWLSKAVSTSDAAVFTTNAEGKVVFDLTNTANNPFKTNDVFPLYANLMVVVGAQQNAPSWMNVFEVQTTKINGASEYILDMVLGGSAPAVSLTSPASNASFASGATINLAATASDADGTISKVEFYSGSTLLGSDASSPYSYAWPSVPAGTYTVMAKATDNSSLSTTSSAITVNVTNGSNTPPTVSVTSPASNATFTVPASITINAAAADVDGTVSKVEFYKGTVKIGEDVTSPYSLAYTETVTGTYALTAKATDNGGVSTTSSIVTVVVNAGSTTNFCFEAESAQGQSTFAPFQVLDDANASGGKYIVVPNGTGNQTSTPTSSIATFSFNVPTTATYYFWIRILATSSNDNSLYVRTDNDSYGSPWTPGTYTSWTWKKWTSKSLTAGSHTLSLARNEDGLQIDKVLITKSSSTPSGAGCGSPREEEEYVLTEMTENNVNHLFLSPNPSSDMFAISATENAISYLSVSNSLGKVVFTASDIAQGTRTEFGRGFENGMYFITVKYEDGKSESVKVMKIR